MTQLRRLLPGVLLCTAGGAVAVTTAKMLPLLNPALQAVSPLLLAILLGVLVGNTVKLPASAQPGLQFSAKKVLRFGIVLLGLQISVAQILDLGWAPALLALLAVVSGFVCALLLGAALGLSLPQRLLIGAGFGICGAAAVAAVDGVLDDDKEEHETATALGLVVLFGTLMIFLLPLAARLAGLSDWETGVWAGASVHEVAQVVAIGGSLSAAALSAAVIVKLSRVLLLAPVMATISVWRRHNTAKSGGKLPPIMPLFVFLFIVMVAVRSLVPLPAELLAAVNLVQTVLLAVAMFALGLGVRFSVFKRGSWRPFIVALVTTLVIAVVTYGGLVLLIP